MNDSNNSKKNIKSKTNMVSEVQVGDSNQKWTQKITKMTLWDGEASQALQQVLKTVTQVTLIGQND